MAEPLDINVDLSVKLLNIQKEITQEIENRRKVLEQIDFADNNVAKSILSKMSDASKKAEGIKRAYVLLAQARVKLAGMGESAEKQSLKKIIDSRTEALDFAQMQIQKSRILWEQELKILEETKKRHDFIYTSIRDRLGIETKEFAAVKKHSEDLITLFPKMKAATSVWIGAIMSLTTFARKMYEDFENAAWEFRKTTGMMRDQARALRGMAENAAIEFAHVGVKIEEVYKSILALGPAMGSYHNVTKEVLKTTSLLASQLGVAEENTVGVLRTFALVSRSTMQSQKNFAYFASDMAAAAGVPLNDVMGDVAKMSGVAYSMVAKTPMAIMKAAIEARRLNTTINDMSKASESILDFQNSVNAEMEASVLLGESINLQRARYLAYNNKIVESTQEILRLAQRHGFHTKMDYFQREAFAKATGRSVEELMKMLQAEEEMAAARRSTNPTIQAQLKAYEAMKAANEATAKANGENVELMLMQRANQQRMVAIQNQWNQLLMQASQIFLPIIDASLKLTGAFMNVANILFTWAVPFKLLEKLLRGMSGAAVWAKLPNFATSIAVAAKWFGKAANYVVTLGGLITGVGAKLATWAGPLMKFISPFMRFLGPIGWVITAFQLISSIWKNFGAAIRGEISIWKALGNVIYEVFLSPFKKAWEWIKSIFVGRSPSFMAMGVVKGITSVAGMLFDALTYPWRKFFAWVMDKIPGMGDTAKKLREGMGGGTISVERQAAAAYVPVMEFKTKPTEAGIPAPKVAAADKAIEETQEASQKTLNDILSAIQLLNKNLESGKIGVYVDGQLMSATVARQTAFKGGFGMNVA